MESNENPTASKIFNSGDYFEENKFEDCFECETFREAILYT